MCCVLLLGGCLLAASPARASTPMAGQWVATFSTASNTRMTFTVSRDGRRITNVVVHSFLVFCTSTDDSSFDTWTFPSLRVGQAGAFGGVHRTSIGSSTQKYILRGHFTGSRSATGYAEEQSLSGYCVGGSKWQAHHR